MGWKQKAVFWTLVTVVTAAMLVGMAAVFALLLSSDEHPDIDVICELEGCGRSEGGMDVCVHVCM